MRVFSIWGSCWPLLQVALPSLGMKSFLESITLMTNRPGPRSVNQLILKMEKSTPLVLLRHDGDARVSALGRIADNNSKSELSRLVK
jgi:hypothetical protein